MNATIARIISLTSDEEIGQQSIEDLFKFKYIFAWLSICISIVGICGNLMSLMVLSSKHMKTTTNIYLLNLCTCGIFSLVGLLINSSYYNIVNYYGYARVHDDTHGQDNSFIKMYPYVYAIITTFQMAFILLTVAVSLNKFFTIYSMKIYNTKIQYKLDLRRTKMFVFGIYLFSILFCAPYWLKYEYNTQERRLKETKIGSNKLYKQIVHFWLYLPIVYIIPFILLIATNSFLFYTIVKLRQRRLQLFENNRVLGGSSIYLRAGSAISLNQQANETCPLSKAACSLATPITYANGFLGVPNQRHSTLPLLQTQSPPTRNISIISHSPSSVNIFKPKKIAGTNVTCMLIAVVFLFLCVNCLRLFYT